MTKPDNEIVPSEQEKLAASEIDPRCNFFGSNHCQAKCQEDVAKIIAIRTRADGLTAEQWKERYHQLLDAATENQKLAESQLSEWKQHAERAEEVLRRRQEILGRAEGVMKGIILQLQPIAEQIIDPKINVFSKLVEACNWWLASRAVPPVKEGQ